jgi:hypothetical protein
LVHVVQHNRFPAGRRLNGGNTLMRDAVPLSDRSGLQVSFAALAVTPHVETELLKSSEALRRCSLSMNPSKQLSAMKRLRTCGGETNRAAGIQSG